MGIDLKPGMSLEICLFWVKLFSILSICVATDNRWHLFEQAAITVHQSVVNELAYPDALFHNY